MGETIFQFLIGVVMVCGLLAYINTRVDGKRLNKLEKRVNELDNAIKELKKGEN